jgi:anti-sigma-K factor RskA
MSTHERKTELSAYLLGELGAEEHAAFERALAQDASLRAEVERLRPVVARLDALPAEGWEDAPEPPPLRLPSQAAASAATPAPAAAPARRKRRRRWLRSPLVVRPAFAALGAAALLAAGIAIGVVVDEGGSSSGGGTVAQRTVALQPLQQGVAAQGRALVADAGGKERVTLRLRGLPPSRARQFYEVWLMDASGPLIAIGSFRVGADGRATVELPLPVEATKYQYFDISVQPEGNDADHSGESVLRGATA